MFAEVWTDDTYQIPCENADSERAKQYVWWSQSQVLCQLCMLQVDIIFSVSMCKRFINVDRVYWSLAEVVHQQCCTSSMMDIFYKPNNAP